MRRISSSFTAVKSLGVFGFILVLNVAIIGWFTFNVIRLDAAVKQIRQEAEKRDIVGHIEFFLFQLEWEEKYFLLAKDSMYAEWHNEDASIIDGYIAQFLTKTPSAREKRVVDDLARGYGEYRQTFAEIVAASDAGNWDEAKRLHDEESAKTTGRMHEQVEALIFEAEMSLVRAVYEANLRGREAIFGGVISLIIFPFLAVWAFGIASRITQPVLTLTNAVIAIEGNQFRPDLLADVIDRHGGLGRLAQALEQMAQKIRSHEENLEQEVRELRGRLYETRRRRLIPTTSRQGT